MAGLIKSCLLCSLKTGCFLVAFYTFMLSMLLLVFNVHDFVYARDFIMWSRIISFIFSVLLFFAAICLLGGLLRTAHSLLGVWMFVFFFYILYQMAFVSWNIYYYTDIYHPVPADIQSSLLVSIILFGILIFINIIALVAVHSEREHMRGKGMIAIPVMA